MIDFAKLVVVAGLYGVAAPVAGFALARWRRLEDAAAVFLVFLLGQPIDQTVVMVRSIEWYRGVTKGFEFTLMEVVAIALITARFLDRRSAPRGFAFVPAGTLVWGLHVAASTLSIVSAVEPEYVLMGLTRFSKAWLLAYAVANYVRTRREAEILLLGLAATLLWQFLFVARMKWIDGIYQVRGLFEHQNPLAMFTYMAALPLLAAALSPAVTAARSRILLAAFGAGAIIILATLSRASLAVFAAGTVAVVAWGFLDRVTWRRVGVAAAMAFGGAVVLAFTLDTIVSRFHDEGNEASGETRDVMNLAAAAMLADRPLGIGWNCFGKAVNHPYPYGDVIDDWNRDRGQPVDEDYAKGVVESHYWLLLGETGYPGFATFVLFAGLAVARAGWLAVRRRGTLEGALGAGLAIAFLLTHLHSTLERVLTQTRNLGLWMVLLGLLAALLRFPAPPRPPP